MAEIRALRPAKREPDAQLVALLEQLLTEAKAGELSAFVGVADFHDRDPDYITAGVMDFWAMSARLADLSRDIVTDEEE